MINKIINKLNKKQSVLDAVRAIKVLRAEEKKELFTAYISNDIERMSDILLISLSRIKGKLGYIEDDLIM